MLSQNSLLSTLRVARRDAREKAGNYATLNVLSRPFLDIIESPKVGRAAVEGKHVKEAEVGMKTLLFPY